MTGRYRMASTFMAALFLVSGATASSSADRFSLEGNTLVYNSTYPPKTLADGLLPQQSSKKNKDDETDSSSSPDEVSDSVEISDIALFHDILEQHQNIKTIQLSSDGGSPRAGYQIGRIIKDYGLDTVAARDCISACTLMFLGGKNRSMRKGGRLGFHHLYWDIEDMRRYYERYKDDNAWADPVEFAAWAYVEGQRDANILIAYMVKQDVSADFAVNVGELGDHVTWYPERDVLLEANVLRSFADEKSFAQRLDGT